MYDRTNATLEGLETLMHIDEQMNDLINGQVGIEHVMSFEGRLAILRTKSACILQQLWDIQTTLQCNGIKTGKCIYNVLGLCCRQIPPTNTTRHPAQTRLFPLERRISRGKRREGYALKHQYRHDDLKCISPTDPDCITVFAHADIRVVGNTWNSSVGDSSTCGASGNCAAHVNRGIPGVVDQSCRGEGCAT